MKISILLVEGAKQIMLTPETEHEKTALKMISPEETIEAVVRRGSFSDEKEVVGVSVEECKGGYYRGFKSSESLMFIIKPKAMEPAN